MISKIYLKDNESKRMNCIFCGGYNTLGISKIGNILKWHCYRASCSAHGQSSEEHSLNSIKYKLSQSPINITSYSEIPILVEIKEQDYNILNILETNHTLEAFHNNLLPIQFSPSENRIMLGYNSNKSWVGRSVGNQKPKWKKFGETGGIFSCGSGQIGVLVEDAFSACAVGVIPDYTGIALLGTSLVEHYKPYLLKFSKVLVCLDQDASLKSIKISKQLPNSEVRLLQNDLKYYDKEEINKFLTKDVSQ